jgi:hypothetical protein
LEAETSQTSNPFAQFASDHLVVELGAKVLKGVVRFRFKEWCKDHGRLDILDTNSSEISRQLARALGVEKLASFRPHGDKRYYKNLRLAKYSDKAEADDDDDEE